MTASAQIKPAGSINHVGVRYLSPEGANNIEIYDDPDIGGTANLLMTINVTTGAVNFEGPIGIHGRLDSFGAPTVFVPTISASGSMTASSGTGGSCKYWELGDIVIASYYFTDIVLGGTPGSEIRFSLPVTAGGLSYMGGAGVGNPAVNAGYWLLISTTSVAFRTYDWVNFATGSNNDVAGVVIYERA